MTPDEIKKAADNALTGFLAQRDPHTFHPEVWARADKPGRLKILQAARCFVCGDGFKPMENPPPPTDPIYRIYETPQWPDPRGDAARGVGPRHRLFGWTKTRLAWCHRGCRFVARARSVFCLKAEQHRERFRYESAS